MKNRVFVLLGVGFLMFNGCVMKYKSIMLPSFEQKTFSLYEENQHYLLIASCKKTECLFSLIDSFGSPIVSRKYQNEVFSNVKFLPPNSKYDSLFYEIIKNPNLSTYKKDQTIIEPIDE